MLRFTYPDKNIVINPDEIRYSETEDFPLVSDLLHNLRYI
jgi:hypothetical protein